MPSAGCLTKLNRNPEYFHVHSSEILKSSRGRDGVGGYKNTIARTYQRKKPQMKM